MATMVNGTNMVLSIDDTTNTADGTTPVLTAIAAATSCTLTLTVDAPEVDAALTLTVPDDIVADTSIMSVSFVLSIGPCDTNTFVPSVTTVASPIKFSSLPFWPVIT